MRTKIILSAAIAILTASLWVVGIYASVQKKERIRHENNVYALSEELVQRTIQDSVTVSQKRIMELKASEFERLFKKESEKVKMLGVKLKNVESMVSTKVVVRDTIKQIKVIYVSDSVIKFSHSDNFFVSLNGEINKGDLGLDYEARLELDIVQHREPKRFLGFLWRTKKTKLRKVEVFSMNPKVIIEGITAIKID